MAEREYGNPGVYDAADPLDGTETLLLRQDGATVYSTISVICGLVANPLLDDGDALGTASLQWSDLYLASGGRIKWDDTDVEIVHSAGLLTLNGKLTVSGLGSATSGTPINFVSTDTSRVCFHPSSDLGSGIFKFINNGGVALVSIALDETNFRDTIFDSRTFIARGRTAASPAMIVRAPSSVSANYLLEFQNSSSSLLAGVRKDGSWKPPHLADSAAANDSVYYSTDSKKLVYKDSSGTANQLY